MTLEAVLFDLDDTLYPERTFVHGGFAAVGRFLEPRLQVPATALAARLVELHGLQGRGRLFDTLLEECGRPSDPDLVLACLLVYRNHVPALEPFPDVVAALRTLRGRGLLTGIVSDGLSWVQHGKLRALPGIVDLLDVVVMTDDLGPGHAKPSPTPFRVACRLLDVRPERAAYVGNDPRKDFLGARQAGLLTVRVGRVPDEGGATMVTVPPGGDADWTVETLSDALPLLLDNAIAQGDQP